MDIDRTNPANLRPMARRLLGEAAYAVALTDPETSRRECQVESDIRLHIDDEKAGETISTHASVEALSFRNSLIAPAIRFLASRRSRGVKENYRRRSHKAARERLEHIAAQQETGRNLLTWRSDPKTFPKGMSPLDMHRAVGGHLGVDLTPYQIQACGVIEVVRAAGRVIGNKDGDWLADQFMRMVIDLSGEGDWSSGSKKINGEFMRMAESSESVEGWVPLEGRNQLLAVTVLASWIRMSRLGVTLASRDRHEAWRSFFDGTLYGARTAWLGDIWHIKPKKTTEYQLAAPWRSTPESPWFARPTGSPVPVVGIAGEVLRSAITRVQVIGMVPDDFKIEDKTEPVPCYDESNRILTQLKKVYREIAGFPIGSVISVSAPDLWY